MQQKDFLTKINFTEILLIFIYKIYFVGENSVVVGEVKGVKGIGGVGDEREGRKGFGTKCITRFY